MQRVLGAAGPEAEELLDELKMGLGDRAKFRLLVGTHQILGQHREHSLSSSAPPATPYKRTVLGAQRVLPLSKRKCSTSPNRPAKGNTR